MSHHSVTSDIPLLGKNTSSIRNKNLHLPPHGNNRRASTRQRRKSRLNRRNHRHSSRLSTPSRRIIISKNTNNNIATRMQVLTDRSLSSSTTSGSRQQPSFGGIVGSSYFPTQQHHHQHLPLNDDSLLTDDSMERSIKPEIKEFTRTIEHELKVFEQFLEELILREDVLNGFSAYIKQHPNGHTSTSTTTAVEDNKEDLLLEDYFIELSYKEEIREAFVEFEQKTSNRSGGGIIEKQLSYGTSSTSSSTRSNDTAEEEEAEDDSEDEGREVGIDELLAPSQALVRGFLERRRTGNKLQELMRRYCDDNNHHNHQPARDTTANEERQQQQQQQQQTAQNEKAFYGHRGMDHDTSNNNNWQSNDKDSSAARGDATITEASDKAFYGQRRDDARRNNNFGRTTTEPLTPLQQQPATAAWRKQDEEDKKGGLLLSTADNGMDNRRNEDESRILSVKKRGLEIRQKMKHYEHLSASYLYDKEATSFASNNDRYPSSASSRSLYSHHNLLDDDDDNDEQGTDPLQMSMGSVFSMIHNVSHKYEKGSAAASAVALVMQAAFRGYDVDGAIICIQTIARGYIARRWASRQRRLLSLLECDDDDDDDSDEDRTGAIVIDSDDEEGIEDEGIPVGREDLVLPIQACVRGHLARQRYERRKRFLLNNEF